MENWYVLIGRDYGHVMVSVRTARYNYRVFDAYQNVHKMLP